MHAALQKMLADATASDAELGGAFGELGVLLHAAEYYDAAEPAYLNAQALMPTDPRWPYFLGHLYKTRGDSARSLAAFERASQLAPSDVATLVWLGRGYQELGQPERAMPMFDRALQVAPDTVAALAGLGQIALARNDFARATELLEKALAINPGAASLHSPLAQAYRGLGDTAKAEAHLQQWRNTDILVRDPMREQLDLALQSGLAYELRGVRALEARDFSTALEMFREGVKLAPGTTPLGRSLRHKLGTALALTGDTKGAVEQFQEVVRLAPAGERDEPAAKAHYSLGVLAASTGNVELAARHLTQSLTHNPAYFEARLAHADVLRRHGRFAAALTQYEEALKVNPRSPEARFGYAMGLVRMNRYRDARTWLEDAVRSSPERPELANALARILAAAPEADVRDGHRAMSIVKQLFGSNQTSDVVETMAMAAAEVGNYSQAVAIQRELLDAAKRAGQYADVNRLVANLRLYEKGQPSRTPWPSDHPVHQPGT